MSDLFEQYKGVVLDSALFPGRFSEELQESLCNARVFAAANFIPESNEYLEILPASMREDYRFNLLFLRKNILVSTPRCSPDDAVRVKSEVNHTLGLLKLLQESSSKLVLLTANRLLIEQIVLNRMHVDIYDLNQNCLISNADYPELSAEFDFKRNDEKILIEQKGKPSEVYCASGRRVLLGQEMRRGAEASIYEVSASSNQIAKIFHKDCLSGEKYENLKRIENINEKMDISWAQFPSEMLYYDTKGTHPAGFLERKVISGQNISEIPVYCGDTDLPEEYLQGTLRGSLELCRNVVRQVLFLNRFGFMIADYNFENFACVESELPVVQMWDTDSFSYGPYFAEFCAGNQNSREYDITKKESAISYCNEELVIFTFKVLSLFDVPVSSQNRRFKYDNPDYLFRERKYLFPDNLWKLYEQIFRDKKTPNLSDLLLELQIALKGNDARLDKTYQILLQEMEHPQVTGFPQEQPPAPQFHVTTEHDPFGASKADPEPLHEDPPHRQLIGSAQKQPLQKISEAMHREASQPLEEEKAAAGASSPASKMRSALRFLAIMAASAAVCYLCFGITQGMGLLG